MPEQKHFLRLYVAIALVNFAMVVINALIAAGVHSPIEILDRQLDLREEGNVAVWFSSVQLLVVCGSALLVALFVPPPGSRIWHNIAWLGVAAMMLALSADEVAQMHEWTAERYTAYFGENDVATRTLGLNDVYKWLLACSPLAVVGGAWLLWIALGRLRSSRLCMTLTLIGLACWLTTLGAEYIEDLFFDSRFVASRGQQGTVEEGCEILGAGLFLIAFLEFFRTRAMLGASASATQGAAPAPMADDQVSEPAASGAAAGPNRIRELENARR